MSKTFLDVFHAMVGQRATTDTSSYILNDPRHKKHSGKALTLQQELLALAPEHRERLDDLEFERLAAHSIEQEYAYIQGLKDGVQLSKLVSELTDKTENLAVFKSFFKDNG